MSSDRIDGRPRARWLAAALLAACGSSAAPSDPSAVASVAERIVTPPLRSATTYHRTCSVTGDDDHVVCWGLHFGPPRAGHDAESIGSWTVDGMTHVRELDVLSAGVCALVEGGEVRCSLAPDEASVPGPTVTVTPLAGATSIALLDDIRGAHVCAAMPDGSVRCADAVPSAAVTTPVEAHDVLRVARVDREVCLLRRESDVTCFGDLVDDSIETFAGTRDAIAVGSGPCFVAAAGGVRCCNYARADAPCHDEPSLAPAVAAATGWGGVTIAVGRDGSVRFAGGNEADDRSGFRDLPHDFVGLVAQESLCVARSGGELYCLGPNHYGQLDARPPSSFSVPTRVDGVTGAIDVVVSELGGFALGAEGTVFSWTSDDRAARALTTSLRLVALAGSHHARDAEGVVYALARGAGGALDATPVEGLDAHGGLAGDPSDHLCATDARGAVTCLVDQDFVAFGTPVLAPQRVAALDGLTSLAIAGHDACGIRAGRVLCASLARGTDAEAAPTAEEIAVPRGVVRVLGGHEQWLFVLADGSVRVRGHNGAGQLGLAASEPITAPRRGPWVAPVGAAFAEHVTCAWNAEGALRCAGIGADLITRSTDGDGSLLAIPTMDFVRAMSLGPARCGVVTCRSADGTDGERACAQSTDASIADGSVWCWGEGPRADGHPTDSDVPLRVPIETMGARR
jgi:hypothetical protein